MLHEAFFQVIGLLYAFRGLLQSVQLLKRGACEEFGVVDAVEHPPQHIQLVLKQLDGIVGGLHRRLVLSAVGVSLHRLVELLLDAEVVDNQAFVLAGIVAVHAADGLDEGVHLQRLVTVHRVQTGHVEAGNPHVHHDGYLEVRLLFFELQVQLLAVFVGAEHVIQLFGVVFLTDEDHLNLLHRFYLLGLLFAELFAVTAYLHLRPFGAQGDNLLVDGVAYLASSADNHRLAFHGAALFHTSFIVLYEIDCQPMDEVGTVEQYAHLRHRPLAFLYLVVGRALFGTFVVVGFYLLDEFAIGKDVRGAPLVHDGLSDAVVHGLNHRVFIHDGTEDLERRVDGCAGEAHVGGVGQRVAQVFGKAIRAPHTLVGYLHLLLQACLRTVCLVADADDIGAVGEQVDVLGELLYGGEEHAAAGASLQLGFQVLAALHLLYYAVAHKLLGVQQQARQLVVEVGAVGDEDDGGAAQGFALHQQSRQEEHRQRLTAAGGAEVGAALAVTARVEFAVVEDILVQGSGGEVLRVAADELALVFRGVGEVDEVVDDVNKAVLTEQSRHHRLQRGDAAVGLVLGVDLAPAVEEFVRSVECAEFVVHAIGDDDEGGVFEQCRYVAAVADGQLLIGILNGGVLLDGALELEHHDR